MRASLVFLLVRLCSNIHGQFIQYESVDNLIAPRISLTQDNHIILLAEEREYMANSSPIFGGDPYAHYLVKTDLEGNVIWTNKYLSEWKSYPYKLFPQEDGSLITIGKVANTFECLGLNDQFGIPQIELLYFNADGSFNKRVQFPENCMQQYRDVVKWGEEFLLLSWYKHIAMNENEAYLTILNKDGYQLIEHAFEDDKFFRAKMLLNEDGTLSVYHSPEPTTIYHALFDETLQKVKDELLVDFGDFSTYGSQLEVVQDQNGDHIIYSSFIQDSISQVNFLRISDGEIVAQERHLEVYARHMAELASEDFVLAYTDYYIDTTWTMGLLYLDADGKKIKDSLIIHEGNQRPSKVLPLDEDNFIVTGDFNCCNRDSLIGSSNAFLMIENNIESSLKKLPKALSLEVFPNPAGDFIQIKVDEMVLNSACLIYNLLGELVLSKRLASRSNTIDISSLNSGFYSLKIVDQQHRIQSSTFIKQ